MRYAIVLATLSAALSGQAIDIGPPPGRLVDIGGRKLHLNCVGSGAPTIVIEAGASAFAIDFALVQPDLARTQRVCSYDRAGHGWSDPGPSREGSVVADLHRALQAAGERPPYVLAGASRGGLYVRLYTAQHPDEVIGLVLIDPGSEDRLFTMFAGEAEEIASLTAKQRRSTIPRGPAPAPRRPPQTGAPFDRLPKALYDTRVELERRLIASVPESVPYDVVVQAAEDERRILSSLREMSTAEPHPLGTRPLIVLTRGDADQSLRESRERLARLSSNARHMIVAGAGHEIHLFEPSAVVDAVRDVVKAALNKIRLAP